VSKSERERVGASDSEREEREKSKSNLKSVPLSSCVLLAQSNATCTALSKIFIIHL
jgi:hypothetical protein